MNIFNRKETNLLAVFCELRSGLKNNCYLKNSKKIGEFLSEPKYTLIETIYKDCTVGLKLGSTSVVFEVWEVSSEDCSKIENLKGWHFKNYEYNRNNKLIIKTPYGDAVTYIDKLTNITDSIILEDYDYADYAVYQNM
jgi:gamma-glutamylcyclotransferase (GGCT)/AIG2-like uncharacterized protein YtfP